MIQLVSALEAGAAQDTTIQISDASPVGQQLRGHQEGDVIQVKTGGGRSVRYRVLDVRYPHVSP
jgi:transcription elongation GreA/GreB family factor